MVLEEHDRYQPDVAPAITSGNLVTATFQKNLQGKPAFDILGWAVTALNTPQTPLGSYAGTFRTKYTVSTITRRWAFAFAAPVVFGNLDYGVIECQDQLASDGATRIVFGQIDTQFQRVRIDKPDYGVQFQFRLSSELTVPDVLLFARKVA